MIFITLGSQKFQFNRVLKYVDKLIEEGIITTDVFAQTGYSTYKPKHYDFEQFLDRESFIKKISKCETVITHGGTGAIITAVKSNKNVIAVPRLVEYKEHVDNHQIQIVEEFTQMQYIKSALNFEEFRNAFISLSSFSLREYKSNTENIIESIDEFILKSS